MNQTEAVEVAGLDLEALERFAELLLHHLPPPKTVGLVGTLGAGKTTLVQAISRAAGIDSADVTSPTFTLLQSHAGKVVLHHLDAYRVADEDEFLELGVDELFDDESAWTLIEWADRVADVMPSGSLWIEIAVDADGDHRNISMRTSDSEIQSALGRVRADMDRSP